MKAESHWVCKAVAGDWSLHDQVRKELMNNWEKNESGAELELHDLEKRLKDTAVAGPVERESDVSGAATDIDPGNEIGFTGNGLEDNSLQRDVVQYSSENRDSILYGANDRVPGAEAEGISGSDAGQIAGTRYSDLNRSVPGEEDMPGEHLQTFAAPQCDLLPAYRDFVLETRDGRFLFSGPEIKVLEEHEQIRFYCQVVADFYTSPGPGVMMVEGNHKYAAVLGRRRLQQIGEITDEFVLQPMQNLKVGKNQSALFYQLVPRSDKTRLQQESEKATEGFLIHDTVSLLVGFLKKMKCEGPVALALHLPDAVLVVAGDHKRVVWARRYTLAGDDQAALKDGFDVISQDIQTASREAGTDVQEVVWIESLTRTLTWPEYSSDSVHFTRLSVFGIQRGKDIWYSSLPGMIDTVPASTSLSEPAERVMVTIGRWEKWILASVVCLALMIAGAGGWMHQHLSGLENQIRQLSSYKGRLQGDYRSLVASVGFTQKESTQAKDAGKAAAVVQRVDQSVPLATAWNSLARMRPPSCRIQALELTYENTLAKLRLEGVIDLGLTQAQAVYSGFLTALEQGGFVVKQQSFQLDVDSNFFSMVLEKPFTE